MNEASKRKPKDDKRVSLPVRLTAETHTRLMQAADERMVHASLIVERAVIAYLATLPSVNTALPLGGE